MWNKIIVMLLFFISDDCQYLADSFLSDKYEINIQFYIETFIINKTK